MTLYLYKIKTIKFNIYIVVHCGYTELTFFKVVFFYMFNVKSGLKESKFET